MKKSIIGLSITAILSTVVYVYADYVIVINEETNNYAVGGFTDVSKGSGWVEKSNDCTVDIIESDVYYNETATQTQSCTLIEEQTVTVERTYDNGTTEIVDTYQEDKINDPVITYPTITGTHLSASCKDALAFDGTLTTGARKIQLSDSSTMDVYCDMDRDGGGWTLVRRVYGNSWTANPFTDNLIGSQSYGAYITSPTNASTFGIIFNTFSYNNLLLTTGNEVKWLITDKESIENDWVSSPSCTVENATVYKSSTNPEGPSERVAWCKRPEDVYDEDPWISIESHGYAGRTSVSDDLTHSMLYGESHTAWDYYLSTQNGVAIYIR